AAPHQVPVDGVAALLVERAERVGIPGHGGDPQGAFLVSGLGGWLRRLLRGAQAGHRRSTVRVRSNSTSTGTSRSAAIFMASSRLATRSPDLSRNMVDRWMPCRAACSRTLRAPFLAARAS